MKIQANARDEGPNWTLLAQDLKSCGLRLVERIKTEKTWLTQEYNVVPTVFNSCRDVMDIAWGLRTAQGEADKLKLFDAADLLCKALEHFEAITDEPIGSSFDAAFEEHFYREFALHFCDELALRMTRNRAKTIRAAQRFKRTIPSTDRAIKRIRAATAPTHKPARPHSSAKAPKAVPRKFKTPGTPPRGFCSRRFKLEEFHKKLHGLSHAGERQARDLIKKGFEGVMKAKPGKHYWLSKKLVELLGLGSG